MENEKDAYIYIGILRIEFKKPRNLIILSLLLVGMSYFMLSEKQIAEFPKVSFFLRSIFSSSFFSILVIVIPEIVTLKNGIKKLFIIYRPLRDQFEKLEKWLSINHSSGDNYSLPVKDYSVPFGTPVSLAKPKKEGGFREASLIEVLDFYLRESQKRAEQAIRVGNIVKVFDNDQVLFSLYVQLRDWEFLYPTHIQHTFKDGGFNPKIFDADLRNYSRKIKEIGERFKEYGLN